MGLVRDGEQARTAWWFGVNNSRGSRADGSPGHVHYRDVAPLLRGEADTYEWPFGGAPSSIGLYEEMESGDLVVFWMGDGVRSEWGILGFGRIDVVRVDTKEVVLRRAPTRTRAVTPYPSGTPKETQVTRYLREVLGETFRPLRKVFVALGSTAVKPYVITVERMNESQYHALLDLASLGTPHDEDEVAHAPVKGEPNGRGWASRKGVEELGSARPYTRSGTSHTQVQVHHRRFQDELATAIRALDPDCKVLLEKGFVDVTVVRSDGSMDLVEVKSAMSSRAVLRQALGQLVEYWYAAVMAGNVVRKLWVAGPAKLTGVDRMYLEYLQNEVGLPIEYVNLLDVEKAAERIGATG